MKTEKEKQQAAHVKALSEILEKHDKELQDIGKQNILFIFTILIINVYTTSHSSGQYFKDIYAVMTKLLVFKLFYL